MRSRMSVVFAMLFALISCGIQPAFAALTYSGLMTIAADAGFQQRVHYAMLTAAVAVYYEAPGTTAHITRAQFASAVLNGQANLASAAAAVLTNATIAAEATATPTPGFGIPDTDIQFAVNSMWNAFAGI